MNRLPRLLSHAALAGAAFTFTASLPSLSSLYAQAPADPQAPDAGAGMTEQGAAGGRAGARGRTGRNAAPTRRNQAGAGTGGAAPRGAAGRSAARQRGAAGAVVPAQPGADAGAGAETPADADAAAGADAAAPDDAAAKAPPPARRAGKVEGEMPDATPAAAQDAAAAPEPAAEPAPDAAATEPAPGADAAATQPGPAATEPAESSLAETVDNFWHYAQIARYDLASAAGNRILNSGAQPAEILAAFEQVAQRRSATRRAAGGTQETLDGALVRWQGIEPLRDVATKLTQTINQGYSEHVMNQEFIQQQIDHLGDNERAYRNAMGRLRQSGQYAVPMMLRYLRDPAKQQLHGPIRNALRDLGRAALSPLLAATSTRDPNLLIPVVTVLGDIGYDAAVPYLVRAGTEPNAPDSVRVAADKALQRLGVDARAANPADLFTDLGEKYYYDTGAVQSDKRSQTTPVWVWDEQSGLSMKRVSSPIFNEVMAMLAAEEALKVGGGQADAASLWLAANNKREAEMPAENGVDEVNADRPPAHFYNVAMGVQRLNNVLARALRDRNAAVALKAVRSLQGVAGQSTLFANAGGAEPLVDAMRFPDRTVHYEAAMAIASSLPQQPFSGQEMVVPLLAEAVSQSGRPNVLLVVGKEAERSRLGNELKEHYSTAGGIGANGAMADAKSLPSVDVILVAADVPSDEIYEVIRIARENPRLERTAKVILRNEGGATWRKEAINDQTLSVSQANDAAGIAAAIEEGRSKTGGLPMDQNVANEFALRAANLLSRLAISRGQVLDLSPALPTLLGALGDPRPEIVHAVGDTLALVPSPQVQPALLDRSQDPNNPPEVRSGLYRSLATSAKFYGSQLGGQQLVALRQTVAADQNQDVRSAAAEALGALNAPVQNVAQLITDHGAGGTAPTAQPESQPAPAEQSAGAEPAASREPAGRAPAAGRIPAAPRVAAQGAGRPVAAH